MEELANGGPKPFRVPLSGLSLSPSWRSVWFLLVDPCWCVWNRSGGELSSPLDALAAALRRKWDGAVLKERARERNREGQREQKGKETEQVCGVFDRGGSVIWEASLGFLPPSRSHVAQELSCHSRFWSGTDPVATLPGISPLSSSLFTLSAPTGAHRAGLAGGSPLPYRLQNGRHMFSFFYCYNKPFHTKTLLVCSKHLRGPRISKHFWNLCIMCI